MNEILSTSIVFVVAVVLLILAMRSNTSSERGLIVWSFVAHIAAAGAQIAITKGVYEGGDMLIYMSEATKVARAFEFDSNRFGALWVDLLLQREPDETFIIMGAGQSTGSMIAIVAFLAILLRFSLFATCLTIAMAAFFGKLMLYRVFRELLPVEARTRMLIALLLVPSAVFWSSGILKEGILMAGIGFVWLGVHRILRRRVVLGIFLVIAGAVPIGFVKPYALFALAISIGAWIAMDRLHARSGKTGAVRIRPIYLVVGAVIIFISVIALSRLFPIYSVENLGKSFTHQQRVGDLTGAGSHYAMGEGNAGDEEKAMSLQRQIVFTPLALVTALFRPFIFEARNGLALITALEATVVTILFLQMFFRGGIRRVVSRIMSTPVLVASLLFVITFGLAVGLATTNFGTLARYRMPLMPFYVVMVLVVGAQAKRAATATTKVPSAIRTRRPRSLLSSRLRPRRDEVA